MARVTYVKKAQQRYKMVPVLGEDNEQLQVPVGIAECFDPVVEPHAGLLVCHLDGAPAMDAGDFRIRLEFDFYVGDDGKVEA